jgi:hypothetical protein
MPTCQICISEMAEVTDSDASTQTISTTNQDKKKYFQRHVDCSFLPLEKYHNDTHERRNEK